MLDNKHSWVAVLTHHGAEETVAHHFEEVGIEYYLPMLVRRDGRRKGADMQEKPMFPCYIFARINKKQIYQTRSTRGVIYIVSSQHSIIQVPDKDIEAVRAFEASQRKFFIRETSQLVKGKRAVIKSGEFAGFEGTLLKGDLDGNFAINIEVMNVSFVLHIKRSELRPAEDDDEAPEVASEASV